MQEEQEEQDAGALEEAHGVPHELGLVLELNASLLGDALQVFVHLWTFVAGKQLPGIFRIATDRGQGVVEFMTDTG